VKAREIYNAPKPETSGNGKSGNKQ